MRANRESAGIGAEHEGSEFGAAHKSAGILVEHEGAEHRADAGIGAEHKGVGHGAGTGLGVKHEGTGFGAAHEVAGIRSGPGMTLWLTGLSGAGKSTIASLLTDRLREQGLAAEWLDGDELRRALGQGLGFSREDRFENIRRAVYVAGMLNRHGVISVVSVISPYAEMRDYARQSLPGFAEVYVDCPLEICESRDVKGLYAKARRGEIPSFTGISDPYQAPVSPELTLRTAEQTPEESVNELWSWLAQSGTLTKLNK
ncbi:MULTISPECIES: adenylyl-sulfate kinase [Paenibacillus]|nr:adenylyl-sulfate kinase [Paenibacillus borealis]